MKILKLIYRDEEYNLNFEPIEFLPNLNLLVGISGSGKTQVLKAIYSLKKIANGGSLNGVCWDLTFSIQNNIIYHWRGKFETQQNNKIIENEDNDNEFKIEYEYLSKGEEKIIERTENGIFFKEQKVPKLSPFESLIELLDREDDISVVKIELDKIIIANLERDDDKIWRLPISFVKQYESITLQEIRESNLPLIIKLSLVYRYFKDDFEKIKEVFIEIFPTVEDIKIEPFTTNDIPIALIDLFKETTVIKIKEKNIPTWIQQNNISSGMLKTLLYISELYLSPQEGVILIDEFENSLGVNCLDSITDLILEDTKHQFIITSHHPYVINNINPSFWKIVIRQGNLIKVKNPQEFHISPSTQKAFIDLINVLEEQENI